MNKGQNYCGVTKTNMRILPSQFSVFNTAESDYFLVIGNRIQTMEYLSAHKLKNYKVEMQEE